MGSVPVYTSAMPHRHHTPFIPFSLYHNLLPHKRFATFPLLLGKTLLLVAATISTARSRASSFPCDEKHARLFYIGEGLDHRVGHFRLLRIMA